MLKIDKKKKSKPTPFPFTFLKMSTMQRKKEGGIKPSSSAGRSKRGS